MSDDAVRRALASLARSAGSEPGNADDSATAHQCETYRETIERATTAVQDLDAAVTFVEDGGVEELERAVERAEQSVSACAEDGARALEAFRAFREAAEGAGESEGSRPPGDDRGESTAEQFHPGHGTSLGSGDIGPSE